MIRLTAKQAASLRIGGDKASLPPESRRGCLVRGLDLPTQLVMAGLPRPVPEYRFAPPRRWRWDFCWPERMLAVEVMGAVFAQGRHTRGMGYSQDCRKLSEGVILGWRVLWVTTQMVANGTALDLIRRALEAR